MTLPRHTNPDDDPAETTINQRVHVHSPWISQSGRPSCESPPEFPVIGVVETQSLNLIKPISDDSKGTTTRVWNGFRLKQKCMSEAAKEARAKSKYPHRLGQSGYFGLRERLIKNFCEDGLSSRSFMWRKARMSKGGDYKDNDLMVIANTMVDHEKEIQDGCIKRDHGTDALTLVFGKEHGGHVREIGRGVQPNTGTFPHIEDRQKNSSRSYRRI